MVSATVAGTETGVLVVIDETTARVYSPENSTTCSRLKDVTDQTVSLVSLTHDSVLDVLRLNISETSADVISSKMSGVFCHICEHLSRCRYNLKQHVKQHEIENGIVLACGKCPKTFKDNHELSVHIKICKFRCNLCDFSNSRKKRVEQHMRRAHKYDDL